MNWCNMTFIFIVMIKKVFSLNIIIFFSCTLILLYQIGKLFDQYLAANTVTNIVFSKNVPEQLPAITICHDKLFSFEKMAYHLNYSNFIDIFKNFTSLFGKYKSNSRFQLDKFQNDSLEFQNKYNTMEKNILKIIKSSSLGFKDIMKNLTLPYYNFPDYKMQPHIEIIIFGQQFDQISNSTILFKRLEENMYLKNISPIESIIQGFHKKRKCFTFFSSLQTGYSNIKFIIKEIHINILFNKYWSPYPISEVYLSIHSPYEIEHLDSFVKFPISRYIKITYNRINNNEDPSYHNCHDYNNNNNNNNCKNKFDCFYKCIIKSTSEFCLPYELIVGNIDYPVPIDFLPKQYPRHYTMNCSGDNNIDALFGKCARSCKEECHQEYFFFESKPYKQQYTFNEMINIRISKNNLPTITIYHLPEMTLISLLCNLGGLIGMWLGISIASTIDNLSHLVKKLITKLLGKIKIFIVNNSFTMRAPSYNFLNLTVFRIKPRIFVTR